ncbi:MAG: hypothetical protein CSA81_00335 [Acidobacteria bacterium]|nr:MAG: hypothetical protein CSA81_00335 [Acidobacteriota bacterium]
MNIRFFNEGPHLLDSTIKALRRDRLYIPTAVDYPDHDRWLFEKVIPGIESGDKHSVVCVEYDGVGSSEPIAAIVYQQSQENPLDLEIKNVSVAPEVWGREIGRCALAQVIKYGPGEFSKDINSVVVDTKETNLAMMAFLKSCGFVVTDEAVNSRLGHNGVPDVLLRRPLDLNKHRF